MDASPPDLVYFDFTAVQYERGDLVGEFFALLTLAPIFAMVAFATAIVLRRDLQTVVLLAGQIANLALNLVLNRLIQQPRPNGGAGGPAGAGDGFRIKGSSSGMPSNHAQVRDRLLEAVGGVWPLHCHTATAIQSHGDAQRHAATRRHPKSEPRFLGL